MLSVNSPHAGLRVFGSLDCGVDYDGLLFLFLHAAFGFAALCDTFAFACSVFGLTLFFLYVDEFLIAACGVSPLRGRPALAKAQGLDPNAF